MTYTSTLDTLCTFFGGPYDAARQIYANPGAPPVAGLYAVKRGEPKSVDPTWWKYGANPPPAIGAMGFVFLSDNNSSERRIALGGATSGIKKVAIDVNIQIGFRADTNDAEPVEDAITAMVDAMLARIRSDRTCGSGGFELGGLQIAETDPWLRWRNSKPKTSAGGTKASLFFMTEAHYYVQA